MNSRQEHDGMSYETPSPTGRPDSASRGQTTTWSESWFATTSHEAAASGDSAKLRGVLPPLVTWSTRLSSPVSAATSQIAIVSWKRFEPYTNRPSGDTTTWAQEFGPS